MLIRTHTVDPHTQGFPFSGAESKNLHSFVSVMWTILKVFIECVTISLLFCILVFWAMRHIGS